MLDYNSLERLPTAEDLLSSDDTPLDRAGAVAGTTVSRAVTGEWH